MKKSPLLYSSILSIQLILAISSDGIAQEKIIPPIEKVLRVVHFDVDQVSDKIRFDSESQLNTVFEYCFATYEQEVLEMEETNQEQIDAAFSSFEKRESEVEDLMDFDQVSENLQILKAEISPFQKELDGIELKLDSGLKLILTEKQYHKWEHYFAKQKKAAKPKMPMPMAGPTAETLLF